MSDKILISLYDHSGNWSEPYLKDGWAVLRIDLKNGLDVMDFHAGRFLATYQENNNGRVPKIGLLIAQPCTCYALCGNRHKKARLLSGEFAEAQKLVAKSKEIIDFFQAVGILDFWVMENPKTDIHKKNLWIGPIMQKFNPCDFAGYSDMPDNDRYNKETWLFGQFNPLLPKRLEPIYKENPGWKNLGGKSERTKELRSVTPKGFAQAFFESNH